MIPRLGRLGRVGLAFDGGPTPCNRRAGRALGVVIGALALLAAAGALWTVLAHDDPIASREENATPGEPASASDRRDAKLDSILQPDAAPPARSRAEATTVELPSAAAGADIRPRIEERIDVRFVDAAGYPLADVHLTWHAPPRALEPSTAANQAVSDRRGRASLAFNRVKEPATTTQGVLLARRDGHAPASRSVSLPLDGSLDLGDWVLEGSTRVSGTVRAHGGETLADAQVTWLDATNLELGDDTSTLSRRLALALPGTVARTAGDGGFELDVPAGDRRLVALHERWSPVISELLRLEAGSVRTGIELVANKPTDKSVVAGIVLTPDATPAVGARVRMQARGSMATAYTDATGNFRFAVPRKSKVQLSASDPEGAAGVASLADIAAGTTDVVLQLVEPAWLELDVVDSDGLPIQRCSLFVQAAADGRDLSRALERECPGGRTRVAVPAETYFVEVFASDCAPARVGPFAVDSAGTLVRCVLVRGRGLSGVVTTQGGPARGATVSLHRRYDPPAERLGFRVRSQTQPEWSTTCGDDGRYFLPIARAGDYFVRATLGNHAPDELGPIACTTETSETHDLELGFGGELVVSVRTATSASVAGRPIAISRGDGAITTGRTDAKGRARFTRLTPGRWDARLLGDEPDVNDPITRFPGDTLDSIPWLCTVTEGGTTELELWIEATDAPFVLAGSLYLGDAPAATWLARWSDAAPDEPSATLDATGGFSLASLRGGARTVQFLGAPDAPCGPTVANMRITLEAPRQRWDLRIDVGTLRGTRESRLDTLLIHRVALEGGWFVSPLAEPGTSTFARCVPAGDGECLAVAADLPLEAQALESVRSVHVPPAGFADVEIP